jgi:hypothetical protein
MTQQAPRLNASKIDAVEIARNYIACWNETDGERRRALLAQYWSPDAQYIDPLTQAAGRESIDALIAAVQARFPGHSFSLKEGAEGHNDRLRFAWSLGPNGKIDAAPIAHGTDFAELTADGRLDKVTGFLDQASA